MKPSRRTPWSRAAAASAVAAAAVLAVPSGCAVFAASARDERLQAQLDTVSLELPLDQIWPQVRHLLAERGHALAGKDAEAEGQSGVDLIGFLSRARETTPTTRGGRRLETGWDGRRVRYVAEAIPDGASWRVNLTAVHEDLTEHGHDGYASRDPGLELELLSRIAPAQAVVVRERAEAERPVATGPASAKPPR
jgi:hypothetical protein